MSTINMTGGTIKNNEAEWAGGVNVNSSTFNMSGGIIENNRAASTKTGSGESIASGGGIAVWDGGTQGSVVNISGDALIQNNFSGARGGGISLGTLYSSNHADTLNMTGGTIKGNTAGNGGGGGIFVQAGNTGTAATANISGGKIIDNAMDGTGTGNKSFGGGGIYVNGYRADGYDYGTLNLTNALITNNSATIAGGGYAGCPISETHFYVKNGTAIYNNEAESGAELYFLASNSYGAHSGNPDYTITNSMLGGTPYHWKYDNGDEVPLNKLDGTLVAPAELALHTSVSSDATAESLAKVVISGNTSTTRGGGIGSNGAVNMGEYDTITISVEKKWSDVDESSIPDSITVNLYRTVKGSGEDPIYIGKETMTPDSEGNWKLTFTNLPKEDANGNTYEYSVKEEPIDGFNAKVTGDMARGFVITNTKKVTPPTPPTTPTTPSTPSNPSNPTTTTTTTTNNTTTTTNTGASADNPETSSSETPETGDTFPLEIIAAALGAALAGIAGSVAFLRRKRS